ncbi:MAG TPA: LLM class flavin-dependent oxidoreductase [Candidatus Binataceae bacterium]|nr:LLM class flavin-dependent oxidoreductase [Candidatus Binataceae bacterium]
MKFGVLYNIDYQPKVHGSPSAYFEQILEQVELLEELGYDAAWFGEHHYSGYSFGNPAMIALAAASRTKRLRLGTGVSLIPLHHPLRLAEEYAMLDVLSGGRLDYGVGRGFLSYAYDLFNINMAQSHERYHEGVELIIKAWTAEGAFSFDGRFWKLRDYEFFPKPVQKPHPPIFAAGAGTPASFTWAGGLGLDLCTALFGPDKTLLKNGLKSYRETLASSGYDPAQRTVTSVTQMYCGETKAEALRHGGRYTLNYYKFFASLDSRGSQPSGARALAQARIEDLDAANLVLLGDPDDLVPRIADVRDSFGIDLLLFEVAQGGASHKEVVRSLRLFAECVMPKFKEPEKPETQRPEPPPSHQ